MSDAAAAASATGDVIVSITTAQQVLNSTTVATGSGHDVSNGEEGYGIKVSSSPQRSFMVDTQLSPNLTAMSPATTPGKPPRTPIRYPSRKQSLSRSSFSKPKSRLVEPSYPSDMSVLEQSVPNLGVNSPAKASPRASIGTPKASPTPITPKTPLMAAQGGDDDDDKEDEIYKAFDVQASKKKGKKLNPSRLVEWTALLILVTLLVASITVDSLKDVRLWSLEIWKWCVLVLVVVCGRLVNEWLTNFLVFIIERNFVFKKKVLYFVYGMKKPVQYFFWLGLILLAWELLFNHGVDRSSKTTEILHHITMAIAGCLVGSGLWLIKTLLIKILAVSFHVNRFFDRIQESLFHQYILLTLSGTPQMEIAQGGNMKNSGRLSFISTKGGEKKDKEEVIDVDKLHKMNQGKVSAWTMKGLIKVVRSTGLTTISNTLDNDHDDEGNTQTNEITSEWEAKVEAYKIFNNVATPGHKYIEEDDLLRFMKKEEADIVFPLFEGATETGKIKRSALTKWVVNAYLDRKSLTHSLHDTKTAVEELNRMTSVFAAIVIVIVWNLMMGFLTTKVLVLISSQLLLIVFMFGNTAKTIFEAIIFVFVMHPYDVGDRCVIDGVQMVVEEMNILTTIFLRYDNEKIIYPNSVLATKPISNFYRSPEMSDAVEFAIDFSTTMETISALKARIKTYIESKPQHWKQGHSLQIKEIENMDRMKLALYVNHTINFQNAGEKGNRRCDLMWELKKIFEDLEIKYHLLPQDVHVSYVGTPGLLH